MEPVIKTKAHPTQHAPVGVIRRGRVLDSKRGVRAPTYR